MAGITLREYIREIEKQIDGKRFDEAIAHCQHILQTYPKAADVYRLLGKAFLESQRYGDAADIFQRVLSAIPDDFVSHAGMSIIREDEGNLDEAIWHMERAFDVQPANSALQDELRRLYERRDKVEPPKIRLTRSALARMYSKGELYPQAIAETRAALAESPDRLDLQALLAEIYSRAGQKAEAAEVSAKLLRKLPYCIVANRVLYETVRGTERDSEAQTYLQRLNQVEPYSAFLSETYPSLDSVPDASIRLEKYEWKVGQTAAAKTGQPLWAASLGVNIDEMSSPGENQLPDWLGPQPGEENTPAFSLEVEPSTDQEFAWDAALPEGGAESLHQDPGPEAAPEIGEAIPDWLKDIGWTPASVESQQAEAGYRFEEELGAEAVEDEIAAADLASAELTDPGLLDTKSEDADLAVEDVFADQADADLASADLPDWLREMEPAEVQEDVEPNEGLTPWLDKLFAAPEGSEAAPVNAEPTTSEAAVPSTDEGLPDWMEAGMAAGIIRASLGDLSDESAVEPAEGIEAGDQTPEWLAEMKSLEEPSLIPGEAEGAEIPDWMKASGTPAEQQGEELPAWLFEEAGEEPASAVEETSDQEPAEDEFPSWLFSSEATDGEALSPVAEAGQSEGALPDWLVEEELQAVTSPDLKSEEELPSWLFEEESTPSGSLEAEAETTEPAAEEPSGEEAIPVWMRDDQPFAEEPVAAVPESGDAVPEWLLEEIAQEDTGLESSAADEAGDQVLPDWLAEEPEIPATETPLEEIPDWLRTGAMAAAAGASADWLSEETSTTEASPAEAGEEQIPGWLSSFSETPEEAAEQAGAPGEEEESTEAEFEEAAILGDTQPTRVSVPSPAQIPDLAEAFAWLAAMMTPIETEPAETIESFLTESEMVEPAADQIGQPSEPEAKFQEIPAEAFAPEAVTVEDWSAEKEIVEPAETNADNPPTIEAGIVEIEQMDEYILPDAEAEVAESVEADADIHPATEPPPAELPSFPLDDDDAFAWLESLAVKQGAQEALLLTADERTEKPPDWVQQAVEEAVDETTTAEAEEAGGEAEEVLFVEPEADFASADEGTAFTEEVSLSAEEASLSIEETFEESISSIEEDLTFSADGTPSLESQAIAAVEAELPPEEGEEAGLAFEGELPKADVESAETAAMLIEPETTESEEATAETAVNWVGSVENETVLDEMQSAPTEKLNVFPGADLQEKPVDRLEETPDLPDWLAGVESEAPDEPIEWRPPVVTRRRYDLNQASLVELERLPGIGFIMAQRIIDYRETFGGFRQVEDLLNVPEFSAFTLESIRDNLFVIPGSSESQPARSEPVSSRPSTRRPARNSAEPGVVPETTEQPSDRPPSWTAASPNPEDASAPELIREARQLSEQGDWTAAQAAYNHMLQSGQHLDFVINDLNSAVLFRPEDVDLWQLLGDAYLRVNRLKEAMQSYSMAEKLLR